MNENTHVYCTNCQYGDVLIARIVSEQSFVEPTPCIGCCSCNPEDSMRFRERPNYQPIKPNERGD